MGHPEIDNRTPFSFAALYASDEQVRPLLVVVVRATYELRGGEPRLADEQAPVSLAGELSGADTASSSWRLEPELAFYKPATDVVLLGHACAPRPGTTEVNVQLQVGPVTHGARVFGDRVWRVSAGVPVMSRPRPFERIPLLWERAFGGRDHSVGTPERPQLEPRNPVGVGFHARGGRIEDGAPLPNLEDPADPIRSPTQVPTPVGFGFTASHWQPRARLAGTYDETWLRERRPRLPHDFDRRHFNAAAPGLVAPGHLRGDEPVTAVGVSATGRLTFRLPGVPPPVCRVAIARSAAAVETRLDTVVLDADARRLYLTWRGHVTIPHGPHDVRAIAVQASGVQSQPGGEVKVWQ